LAVVAVPVMVTTACGRATPVEASETVPVTIPSEEVIVSGADFVTPA
jgi:hypothetical protein